MKSKKGGSPYDVVFKLADLGLSHFKKHVPSQRDVTDRDTYGTRAYGRLHSNNLPGFTVADGSTLQVPRSAIDMTATLSKFAYQ